MKILPLDYLGWHCRSWSHIAMWGGHVAMPTETHMKTALLAVAITVFTCDSIVSAFGPSPL